MKRQLHGLSKTKMYRLWNSMKDRCFNPNNKYYHRYGGRGISVCERWCESFTAYHDDVLSEIGAKPGTGYSIDRKDNDGNYEPGNIRWATPTEQSLNSSLGRPVERSGQILSRKAFATEIGISPVTLNQRINRGGMSLEDAVVMIPYNAKLYELNGESLTLREWAARYDTDYFRLYHSVVRKKKPLKEALDKPKGRAQRYDYNGRSLTLKEWAEVFGVKDYRLKYLVQSRGVSIDEAIKMIRVVEQSK